MEPRTLPMGAWSGGPFNSDFAQDLKRIIAVLLRSPLSDDEVLAELWASQGADATELDAIDYWLVLADELERRGIHRQDVFQRALTIISAGEDLALHETWQADPRMIA